MRPPCKGVQRRRALRQDQDGTTTDLARTNQSAARPAPPLLPGSMLELGTAALYRPRWCACDGGYRPGRPQALVVALAPGAYDYLGRRRRAGAGRATVYLAPRQIQRRLYAFSAATATAKQGGSWHAQDHPQCPDSLMRTEGYGGVRYDQTSRTPFLARTIPEALAGRALRAARRGFEREIRKRLDYWALAAKRTSVKR